MTKIRAGWLALIVLVAATLLMVFFVWPRIMPLDKPAEPAAEQAAAPAAAPAEPAAPAAPVEDKAAVLAKMDRLKGVAADAAKALRGTLTASAAAPADVDKARAALDGALKDIAGFTAPETLDADGKALVEAAKATASAAAALLASLPADATAALAQLDAIDATLAGKPVEAKAPEAAAADTAATAAAPAPATEPAATEANAAAAVIPGFDVLRVEPDGSTVIAGRAEPGSSLEIIDGDKTISTTDVGSGGDFAAVLDQPLAPGDHQIVLKATKDGKSVTSEEVATVSVPKDASGELLAMVSKPGTASRIITAPKGEATAAAAAPEAPAAAPAETATATPAEPAQADAAATTAAAAAAVPAELRVTAVEIEGDKLFIAGVGRKDLRVLAYADDALVGDAMTNPDGSFVADGTMPLTVGTHRIRVDQVDNNGKVVLRAEVPFDRPDGEQVAVVAGGNSAPSADAASLAPMGDGTFDKLRDETAKAFALLSGLFDGGKMPADDQYAAARSATEIALKSLAGYQIDANADAAVKDIAGKTATSAGKALALLQSYADAKALSEGLPALKALIDEALSPSAPAAAEAAAAPAAPAAPATETAAADQPTTVTQEKLQPSANASVIIRRGDTLWQISRRVYGQGVRYTTIYLANQDQIKNPDMILPGQIFGVPDKALPNAEEIHRKLHPKG